MKKKVAIIFTLLSIFLYANIVDERNVFSEKSKLELNSLIKKIKEEQRCELYLGTFFSEDDIEVKKRKRVIIVNMIKPKNEKQLKIQLKISQDLNSEILSKKFSKILGEIDETVETDNEFMVSKEILQKISVLLKSAPNLEKNEEKVEGQTVLKRNGNIKFVRKVRDLLALFFAIIIVLIAILPIFFKNCKFIKEAYKETRCIKTTLVLFFNRFKKNK